MWRMQVRPFIFFYFYYFNFIILDFFMTVLTETYFSKFQGSLFLYEIILVISA